MVASSLLVAFPTNAAGQASASQDPAVIDDPAELVVKYCHGCHIPPPPEALTKAGWQPGLLHMTARLGLAEDILRNPPPGFNEESRQRVLYHLGQISALKSNLIPSPPHVPREQFLAIVRHMVGNAPERPLPQTEKSMVLIDSTPFKLGSSVPFDPATHVGVTLVYIDELKHRVFVGGVTDWNQDLETNPSYLQMLDPQAKLLNRIDLDSAPVSLQRVGREFYLTTIGSLATVQSSKATVQRLSSRRGKLKTTPLLDGEMRASSAQVLLQPDGSRLMVLNSFGYYVGQLTLFHERERKIVSRTALLEEPGAMYSHFGDFNNDGVLDIVSLFSQHLESVYMFLDDDILGYEPLKLFQHHPAWGSSYLDVADMNGDGKPDLIVTNGDNSDFPDAPLKNYHGVRIYLNTTPAGAYYPTFEESFFEPIHGAFKALAADFDLDGDNDIAVIARFLDERANPRENFLYLENRHTATSQEFEFVVSAMTALQSSNFLTMDAGDLDGDGDLDIVLGSMMQLKPRRRVDMEPLGVAFLINQTR
jgi:hypothetical protein